MKKNDKPTTYYHKREYLKNIEIKPESIVFIGNSLIEQGDWNKLSNNKNILNLGIGHEDIDGVSERIENVLFQKPNKVFLMIGTNDLRKEKDTELIKNRFKKLFQKIVDLNSDSEIYIHSILPANNMNGRETKRILSLNAYMMRECKNKGFNYIDLFDYFCIGEILNPAYTTEGLHLNEKGYQIWEEMISNQILSNRF